MLRRGRVAPDEQANRESAAVRYTLASELAGMWLLSCIGVRVCVCVNVLTGKFLEFSLTFRHATEQQLSNVTGQD